MKQLQEMSGLYGIQMIYFSSKMDAYGVWSAEKIWHSFSAGISIAFNILR